MIRLLLYIPILTIILSSCSNFLTWHLDRGIHKASIPSSSEDASKSEDMTGSDLSSDIQKLENLRDKGVITTEEFRKQTSKIKKNTIINKGIKSNLVWSKSTNSGIKGNTSYLQQRKVGTSIFSIDSDGLLTAVSSSDGDILWQVPTNQNVSSGLSVINDKICIGTMDAKLLCYDIESLTNNTHVPLISGIKNATSFSKYQADIDIDLITELSSSILALNNLYLLKLDNDDLYLIDPETEKVVWKSQSINIPLRTKGSSMPLIHNNRVYIARDNGSISSYNQINGTLEWFSIISSRSGRNDLESQRDAEMDIVINNNKIYYGHYQGNIASLDLLSGNIIWSSPFSFINNIKISDNSIYGSTTNDLLVSLDEASGFLNWKIKITKSITEPFIIDDYVMIFTTDGILLGYDKRNGQIVYKKDYGFDLHPQTKFILENNNLYFQTIDGDSISLKISS